MDPFTRAESELEEKSEGKAVVKLNKPETKMGKITEGKRGEQSFQERNNNIIKIWKMVTRSREEENQVDGSNQVLLGKRKGETEGPNGDDQRHLKI